MASWSAGETKRGYHQAARQQSNIPFPHQWQHAHTSSGRRRAPGERAAQLLGQLGILQLKLALALRDVDGERLESGAQWRHQHGAGDGVERACGLNSTNLRAKLSAADVAD